MKQNKYCIVDVFKRAFVFWKILLSMAAVSLFYFLELFVYFFPIIAVFLALSFFTQK